MDKDELALNMLTYGKSQGEANEAGKEYAQSQRLLAAICSYCNIVYNVQRDTGTSGLSHGICAKCFIEMMGEDKALKFASREEINEQARKRAFIEALMGSRPSDAVSSDTPSAPKAHSSGNQDLADEKAAELASGLIDKHEIALIKLTYSMDGAESNKVVKEYAKEHKLLIQKCSTCNMILGIDYDAEASVGASHGTCLKCLSKQLPWETILKHYSAEEIEDQERKRAFIEAFMGSRPDGKSPPSKAASTGAETQTAPVSAEYGEQVLCQKAIDFSA